MTEASQQPPKGAICQHFEAQNIHTLASSAPSESPQQVLRGGLDSILPHLCAFVCEYVCALLVHQNLLQNWDSLNHGDCDSNIFFL